MVETETVDIEVMAWNERGIGFWRSLGFKDRSVYMRFDKQQEQRGKTEMGTKLI